MAAYTTIDNPELYFQCKLYTGDASSTSHTLDGSENMQPDLAWFKSRSRADNHRIVDALRGTNSLKSNTTDAEVDSASDGFTSLDADGFTLNGSGGGGEFNAASGTYVTWCWKMGTTSGISGTGNLTVNGYSFNSTAKQSVIVYTGNGGSSGTYTHGLGSAPGFIFGKNRDEAGDGWFAYHHKNTSAPETDYLVPNTTAATADSDGYWNDVAPTSTLVTVGGGGEVNRAEQQVAYCFAEVQGYSKFGSYTGNGNADGPMIFTGMKPAFVMIKRTDSTTNWYMFDNKRGGCNAADYWLYANTNNSENASGGNIDFLSNGFKIKNSEGDINNSGSTLIYIAFAEAPFVNSNGVPCNAR